ncbi:MAG TPA: hypothetical protein VMY39_01715 [Planctomycetota bacterium]|nr:hypothetical protein [Planctomycetota bacterium]
MDEDVTKRIVDATWKKLLIVCAANVATPVIYVVLGVVLLKSGFQPVAEPLGGDVVQYIFAGLIALSVLLYLVARTLRAKLLTVERVGKYRGDLGRVAQYFTSISLVTIAMSETGVIGGFILFLLTTELLPLAVLAGLSVLCALLMFPSRTKLEELVQAAVRREDDASC